MRSHHVACFLWPRRHKSDAKIHFLLIASKFVGAKNLGFVVFIFLKFKCPMPFCHFVAVFCPENVYITKKTIRASQQGWPSENHN